MLALLRSRLLPVALLCLATPISLCADGGAAHTQKSPIYILIGFVGGFVRHNNPKHGPVKLAEHLERTESQDAYVRVFENRHRKDAYRTILHLLDRNHDGNLSPAEKNGAHIILFGQSWGGAAAVLLARDLDRVGVPVLLTVQVDSVAKFWQNDTVIPPNVIEAVNYYQPHGLVHGRQSIRAANPARTEILGNYRFDYRQTPIRCQNTLSWYDRVLTPGHAQTECDPDLWGQVETLVRERLDPAARVAASELLP